MKFKAQSIRDCIDNIQIPKPWSNGQQSKYLTVVIKNQFIVKTLSFVSLVEE